MLLAIRSFTALDYPSIRRIYEEGIHTGFATFEQEAPAWEDFDKKYLTHSRLLAVRGQEVLGWATLSQVSKRWVYRGVAEVSIYMAADARGQGTGSLLMKKLIESSEKNGIWTLQAVVFEQNKASLQLHKKHGFRKVGYREKIGQMNGVWMDNILFERRSNKF